MVKDDLLDTPLEVFKYTSERQRNVFYNLKRFGGNMYKAMLAAGYSESAAKNPWRLRQTYGWLLMDHLEKEKNIQETPDEYLVLKLAELLEAYKIVTRLFPLDMPKKDIRYVIESLPKSKLITVIPTNRGKKVTFAAPDFRERNRALRIALKLKGSYKRTKQMLEAMDPTNDLSDAELDEQIKELEEEKLQRLGESEGFCPTILNYSSTKS